LAPNSGLNLQVQQIDQRRLHDDLNQALAEWEAFEVEISALDQELTGFSSDGTERPLGLSGRTA
jgi:hypothetical protein